MVVVVLEDAFGRDHERCHLPYRELEVHLWEFEGTFYYQRYVKAGLTARRGRGGVCRGGWTEVGIVLAIVGVVSWKRDLRMRHGGSLISSVKDVLIRCLLKIHRKKKCVSFRTSL